MIFKIVNYAVMGIALFYVAEGTHLIERGKYFPTLPRLDASASDPMAWLGAAQWGVTAIAGLARPNTGNTTDTASNIGGALQTPDFSQITTFAKRLEEKRQASISYYGS